MSDMVVEEMSHNAQIRNILLDLISGVRVIADMNPQAKSELVLQRMCDAAEFRLREVDDG